VVHDPRCLVSMWSDWSPCMNATCHHSGVQIRTRMYADKRAAMLGHCVERLEEHQVCSIQCDHQGTTSHKDKMMMTHGSY